MTSESTPGHEVKIGTSGFQVNIVNSDVQDTVGVVLLALLTLVLVFALMRAHRQNRKLLERLLPKGG